MHGLFWFHDGQFQRVSAGGFNERVENLLQEPDGALWIVTQRGFVRYFDGTAKRLTVASGLPCDSGVNIQDDGHGSKWFYTHCGIIRVSDADLTAWWESPDALVHGRLFDALEGARPNLSNGSPAQTPDGRLWSASDYDFQVIDPQHLPFNKIATANEGRTIGSGRARPRHSTRSRKCLYIPGRSRSTTRPLAS